MVRAQSCKQTSLLQPNLEAASAFEVVTVELGKAWSRLDDGLLSSLWLFFFVVSWGRLCPRSTGRYLNMAVF